MTALLLTCSQSLAKGGSYHMEDRYNPQHIDSLPSEIRDALNRLCGTPRALHPFAQYSDNLQTVVLHYEHFYCSTGVHVLPTIWVPASGLRFVARPLSALTKLLHPGKGLNSQRYVLDH